MPAGCHLIARGLRGFALKLRMTCAEETPAFASAKGESMRPSFRPSVSRAMSAACALAASLLLGTSAAAEGEVAVVLSAARVVVGEHGAEQLVTTEAVRPGDVVEYRATYTNQGEDAVRGLTATLPIPVDTNYLGLTATPESVEASTDGVRFAPIPLMRKIAGKDGVERWEPVPASEYRALRWQIGELAANASRSVAARVVVPSARSVAQQSQPNARHALQAIPADAEHVALRVAE
jgi:uncharacterized repeat protein (TIGR01451 family)